MRRTDWLLLLLGAKVHVVASAELDPVQIQRAMFLLVREGGIPAGDGYEFAAHEWGSYSPALYSDLHRLVQEGLVQARHMPGHSSKRYGLTAAGFEVARQAQKCASEEAGRALVKMKRRACIEWLNHLSDEMNLRTPERGMVPAPRILDGIAIKAQEQEGLAHWLDRRGNTV